jgi:hypothetical protein
LKTNLPTISPTAVPSGVHALWLGLNAPQWVSVAAALFAAISAGAAATAAYLNLRARIEGSLPRLVARTISYQGPGGQVHLEIDNVGAGLANGGGFLLIEGNHSVGGFIGTGTVRPGERVLVRTAIKPAGGGRGLVVCRDVSGNTSAWKLDGIDERRISSRRQRDRRIKKTGRPMQLPDVFHALYGEPLPPNLDTNQLWDVLTKDQIPLRPKPTSLRLDANTRIGLHPPSGELGEPDPDS